MDDNGPANARDHAWSAALHVAFTRDGDEFTAADVLEVADKLSDAHDQTIRRTLNAMAQLGWLEKEDDDHPSTWRLKDRPPWADD